MEEVYNFKMKRYKTPNGVPTCCLEYGKKFCMFSQTMRYGTLSTCVFAPADYKGRPIECIHSDSKTHGDGMGYLITGDWCPVWKEGEL